MTLKDLIRLPLEETQNLRKLDLTPPRGILLYGKSGSGKTALAVACARESGLSTIHVQATSIRSKYVGESEKNLAQLFRRARECAPCILFLDQVDNVRWCILTFRSKDYLLQGVAAIILHMID